MSGKIGDPLSLCWLGLHRWRRWSAPEEVVVKRRATNMLEAVVDGYVYTTTNEPAEWIEEWQTRECDACGAVQRREVKAP